MGILDSADFMGHSVLGMTLLLIYFAIVHRRLYPALRLFTVFAVMSYGVFLWLRTDYLGDVGTIVVDVLIGTLFLYIAGYYLFGYLLEKFPIKVDKELPMFKYIYDPEEFKQFEAEVQAARRQEKLGGKVE